MERPRTFMSPNDGSGGSNEAQPKKASRVDMYQRLIQGGMLNDHAAQGRGSYAAEILEASRRLKTRQEIVLQPGKPVEIKPM